MAFINPYTGKTLPEIPTFPLISFHALPDGSWTAMRYKRDIRVMQGEEASALEKRYKRFSRKAEALLLPAAILSLWPLYWGYGIRTAIITFTCSALILYVILAVSFFRSFGRDVDNTGRLAGRTDEQEMRVALRRKYSDAGYGKRSNPYPLRQAKVVSIGGACLFLALRPLYLGSLDPFVWKNYLLSGVILLACLYLLALFTRKSREWKMRHASPASSQF